MIKENLPYISLDTGFNIIHADDYIKEHYRGLTTPGFLKNLLSGYSAGDFDSAVLIDQPDFHMPGVKLLMVKSGDELLCYPVRTETEILSSGYRNIQSQMREPISTIFATLPMLSDSVADSKSDKAQSALSGIYQQSYKLLRNVTNISVTSRLLSGSMPQKRRFSLSSLLQEIASGMKTVRRDVSLQLSCDDDIYIFANYELISSAVLNLIANSINYKTDRPVAIDISLHRSKEKAVFIYRDNSKGVQDDILPYIFKPYYSKDPYNDGEADPSLGLGLFIFKTAFEQAGGSVLTSSAFGRGITHTVTLPLAGDDIDSLASAPVPFLLDRFSPLFVQLCESCTLPEIG